MGLMKSKHILFFKVLNGHRLSKCNLNLNLSLKMNLTLNILIIMKKKILGGFLKMKKLKNLIIKLIIIRTFYSLILLLKKMLKNKNQLKLKIFLKI